MKKLLAVCMSLLMSIGCSISGPASCGPSVLPEVKPTITFSELEVSLEDVRDNIVFVYSDFEGSQGYSQGSGIMLHTEHPVLVPILTAWHLFYKKNDKRKSGIQLTSAVLVSSVVEDEHTWIKATETMIGCFDARIDLAVVLLPRYLVVKRFDVPAPGLRVAPFDPPVGEEIIIVGNTRELFKVVTRGLVSSYKMSCKTCMHPKLMITDSLMWKGNSGGGLFNKEGHILGVPIMVMEDSRLGLVVPPSIIGSFLKRCQEAVMEQGGRITGPVEVTEFNSPEHFILGSPSVVSPHYKEENDKNVEKIE